jgi:hypothetical protein
MSTEVVARIYDIKHTGGFVQAYQYANGQFYAAYPSAGQGSAGGISVPAVVLRAHGGSTTFAVAKVGLFLRLGDIVKTAPDCILAIEFAIGGRVSVNRGVSVRVEGPKHVREVDATMKRALANTWHLFTHQNDLRRPIEIQTNGGVMGVKG